MGACQLSTKFDKICQQFVRDSNTSQLDTGTCHNTLTRTKTNNFSHVKRVIYF